jgi:hypothetical protein
VTELLVLPVHDLWRRIVERFLPWYDPEVEAARDRHTAEVRRKSIESRVDLERTRRAYRDYADRVVR